MTTKKQINMASSSTTPAPTMAANGNPARRYMFTDFNIPQDGSYDPSNYHDRFPPAVKAACWQLEQCPTTSRLHIQGYLKCHQPVRYTQLKTAMGTTVHFDKCQGSESQCVNYATKVASRIQGPFYWPSQEQFPNHQGKRKDLDDVAESILAGKQIHEVALEYPVTYIRYHKGFQALSSAYQKSKVTPWREVKVYVFFGKTGTGKTRSVYRQCFPDLPYRPDLSHDKTWWDGYEGQDSILLDDFYGQIAISTLLHLLDGYPLQIPVKTAFTQALWTRVFITSNVSPNEWYAQNDRIPDEVRLGMLRRITESIEFTDSLATDAIQSVPRTPSPQPMMGPVDNPNRVKWIPPKKRKVIYESDVDEEEDDDVTQ